MNLRSPMICAALAALMLPLVACGGSTRPAPAAAPSSAAVFPMKIENCGRQVTIPKEVKRIVTSSYEPVELVNAAGGADRIVGTFGNTKDPGSPAFTAVPNPELESDSSGSASLEQIIALRPDVLITVGLTSYNVGSLEQSGIVPLVVSGLCGQHGGGQYEGATFDNIYRDIETYGRMFDTQAQAQAAVERLKQRVAAVQKDGGGKTAVHGYFYGNEFFNSGNQSVAQTQMDMLGLKNSFSDVAKDYIGGSNEELIKRDPQIMILIYYAEDETFEQVKAKFLEIPGVKDMQAVRNNQIIPLPYTQTQATVSAVTGLETIAKGLQTIQK